MLSTVTVSLAMQSMSVVVGSLLIIPGKNCVIIIQDRRHNIPELKVKYLRLSVVPFQIDVEFNPINDLINVLFILTNLYE